MDELGPQQQLFLLLLLDNHSITSHAARERLNLGSEVALAGVISGLSKQLQRLSLKTDDLYSLSVRWAPDKTKTRTFKLSQEFKWVAEAQMGWPDGMPYQLAKLRRLLSSSSPEQNKAGR